MIIKGYKIKNTIFFSREIMEFCFVEGEGFKHLSHTLKGLIIVTQNFNWF